jgi:hypothetical protein
MAVLAMRRLARMNSKAALSFRSALDARRRK